MATFDEALLKRLHEQPEITLRTAAHPKTPVIIWVVAAGNSVFVRSVRGPRGRWYKDLAKGGDATLELPGQRLAVRAIPATDAASIELASGAYLRKYRASPYAQSMVKPEALPTTLRLEPR
jgi:hypothetical protein